MKTVRIKVHDNDMDSLIELLGLVLESNPDAEAIRIYFDGDRLLIKATGKDVLP
jgi:hypothetical protein